MFNYPVYNPSWNPGQQITNLGQGGPQSHMGLLAMQPRTYPTIQMISAYGLGNMPRQVIGPTNPTTANNLSNPLVFNNLQISGLFKSPVGG